VIRTEIHGDVTRLELSHRRSRLVGLSVSAYLVRGVLVDSGFPAIWCELEAFLAGEPVRGAFITHSHEDHAGNVERLAQRGVPIGADVATLVALHDRHRIRFYRRFTWGTPEPLRSAVVPFVDDNLRLVAAPGHTSDHHVVWDAREGTLFSGDLFLGVKVTVAHAFERPRELVRTLRAAISLGPRRMFDAHRGLVPGPVGALEAKAVWLEETIGRIDSLARRGWRDAAIQRAVLGREGLVGFLSAGEYSKRSLVRAVRRDFTTLSSHTP